MSEELRPCPFCGSKAITTTFIDPDDFEYMPIEVNDCDAEVTCENERCINGWYLSPKAWNNRPIEDALNARIAELEHQLEDWTNNGWAEDYKARIAELEGEIAKMKKYFHKPAHGTCCTCQKCGHTYDECRCDFDEALDDLDKANARIAELSQAVGLITTLKPTMVMDTEHPLDMAKEVVEYVTVRIAELEMKIRHNALWQASEDAEERAHLEKLVLDLKKRIAELEDAQRWIPVSERLPEEDTDGNTLMAICRHSGEWVRAPFGAEFADEFVRHYSYWMYAPQPPEVQE